MSQENECSILIVDDSESDRAVYVRYLQAEKNFNYQIIETDSLEAALDSWERNHPDLVLLDINLPDGNGLEFLEAIAQTYPTPKLPVIVMTSQTDTRSLLDAMKKGASDYLFKEERNSDIFRRRVAHLFNELELSRRLARLKQQEILCAEIALRIRAFSNLEDIYQAIVTEVRQFLATDRVIVYQFNPDMSGQIVAESVIRPWEPSLHAQVIDNCLRDNQGIAYQQGKVFSVSDIYDADLTDCHVELLADFQVRANLVVPILLPHTVGQTNLLWGLLIAHECSGPRHWKTDDIEFLQRLSVQLAIALQQSVAYEQLQNELAQRKRAESILQKLIAGTSSVTGEAFFPAFVQNVAETLEICYALITEVVGDKLHTLGFWANGALQPSISYHAVHTPCEYSLRDGEFYCEKLIQKLFPKDVDLVTMKAESYLGVVLKDHEGNTIGNLCILDTKPIAEHKRVEAIAILKIFAARASAELQRKQADEKLQELNQSLEIQVEERTAALQESEITNRTILETIPDLLLRLSPDGTCLDYREPRLEKEKFLPIVHHISEVLPPEIVQNTLRVIERAIATKELQVHEHQLVKQDRLIYEEIRVLAINDQEVLVIVRDISDRKRAEQELMESRQFLQTVLDTFPLSVFWKDDQSVYLGCNQNFAQGANLTSTAEIVGKTDYDLPWGTKEASFYQADDRQVIESGVPKIAIEETITLGTGETRWIETNKIPLRDLDGNVIGVVGTFQDISDRKTAEIALMESEAFNRQLVSEFPIGLASCRMNGQLVYVNPHFAQILGRSVEETLKLSYWDITPIKYAEQEAEQLRQLQETGSYGPYEKEYIHQDGHLVPVVLTGLLIEQNQETLIWSSVQDISDRKQAEQNLKNERLRLQLALDAAKMGAWSRSSESHQLIWSDRVQEIFGFVPGTFSGDPETFVAMIHPEDRDCVVQALDHTFATGEPYHLEYRIFRRDGEMRWISVWGTLTEMLSTDERQLIGVIADISDRKQVEEALRISEIRFRNAFDTTAVGICLVSPLGEFLQVNPALCDFWGYSETELVEMNFQDITHPDDLASDLELLQQLLAGEITHYNLEKRYFTKEQALIWGYLSVSLVRSSQGEPLYFVSQIQDITDQKQAEIALQQSEERFRRIFYSRVVGMIFADFQGRIIDANDCFLDMIGYNREELETGKIDWLGMTPPEYLAKDYECMEYLIQNGEVEPWEKEYYRKDGSRIAILIGAAFLTETNNESICVIIDISDRKQAEKSLRKSQQFIQTIINTVPLPLFWKDRQSVFLGCNQQLAQVLGLSSTTEIEGKTDFELSLSEDQAIAYRAGDQRVITSGEAELGREETYTLDNGELNWIETHKAPLRDGDDNIIGVVGMFQNINERKQYEFALQEKNSELEKLLQLREETLELREDMSNMIVHDLRTPLTTITLAAGMINKYGDRVGQRALIVRKAGQILDSAKQLEKMIDSLLFMAKLEAGKMLFNLIPTDLNRLGSEVIADFELIANSRDIELYSELPNFGQTIAVDATILRRIIDNLMSNALKFSPSGGQVTLSLEYLPENRLKVKVADTGTGISEAEKQKIFQKFEIGSLKRNVSQTGLGLAFCKMAVEAQGGTLAIADNHPQGVIFIVEI
ncbi:MAG: PAS domain S-box protein [Snowella sp.]|nr:PAS domain S-box protein [Snowella sp.]